MYECVNMLFYVFLVRGFFCRGVFLLVVFVCFCRKMCRSVFFVVVEVGGIVGFLGGLLFFFVIDNIGVYFFVYLFCRVLFLWVRFFCWRNCWEIGLVVFGFVVV